MGRRRKSGEGSNSGMASKFITIVKGGQLTQVAIMKPQAPRRDPLAWLSICASCAISLQARHYVFRIAGQWHVYGVDYPKPIKSFPLDAYAAATMYLAHAIKKQAA